MYARAIRLLTLIVASSVLAAGCAPTYAPHLEAPVAPPAAVVLAPLDPRPLLPDGEQSACPSGSGLAACFTRDEDIVRQKRFRILHDDREYCRDAYARAVKHAAAGAVK